MKYYLLPLFALLIVSCGNRQAKVDQRVQDSLYLAQYIDPNTYRDMDDSLRQIAHDAIRSFGFDTMQYHSIVDIDKELFSLFEHQNDYWECGWRSDLADSRLRYHLNNPLTFTEDMPMLDSIMNIIFTPDGKYKFYSYELGGYGTGSAYKTLFQYWDKKSKLRCHSWQDDLRCDSTKGIIDIWRFNYAEQDYYVIKSFRRGSSCCWGYYMEIITMENGKITYHTEFYPKRMFESHDAKHLIYDDDGVIIDECWKPAFDIMVCNTDFSNTNIDYTFDPKTLTVYVKDDANTSSIDKTGAIERRSWKFVLPK